MGGWVGALEGVERFIGSSSTDVAIDDLKINAPDPNQSNSTAPLHFSFSLSFFLSFFLSFCASSSLRRNKTKWPTLSFSSSIDT